MSSPERVSNWKDATAVSLPTCPRCHEANAPGRSPVIDKVGRVFYCNQCGLEFFPTEPIK